jgi:hypothetical protein
MALLSYRRHRFPPDIIQRAIWLYLRFTLSYRDAEELLAERGLDVSYETGRRWVLKFGPAIARRLRQRQRRSLPSDRWHLDEMVVRIADERIYLWRAVDDEGEVAASSLEESGFEPLVPLTNDAGDLALLQSKQRRWRCRTVRAAVWRKIREEVFGYRTSGSAIHISRNFPRVPGSVLHRQSWVGSPRRPGRRAARPG